MPADPRDRGITFVVHPDKLSRYLLNLAHPKGASKAAYFLAHGFGADRLDDLEHALRQHGRDGHLAGVRRDGFGTLFEIDGGVMTPRHGVMHIRTVWGLRGEEARAAVFVTAFPRRG
jgi:hypothetical protein